MITYMYKSKVTENIIDYYITVMYMCIQLYKNNNANSPTSRFPFTHFATYVCYRIQFHIFI